MCHGFHVVGPRRRPRYHRRHLSPACWNNRYIYIQLQTRQWKNELLPNSAARSPTPGTGKMPRNKSLKETTTPQDTEDDDAHIWSRGGVARGQSGLLAKSRHAREGCQRTADFGRARSCLGGSEAAPIFAYQIYLSIYQPPAVRHARRPLVPTHATIKTVVVDERHNPKGK